MTLVGRDERGKFVFTLETDFEGVKHLENRIGEVLVIRDQNGKPITIKEDLQLEGGVPLAS
jgi:formyltetrahydrofolate synthetase